MEKRGTPSLAALVAAADREWQDFVERADADYAALELDDSAEKSARTLEALVQEVSEHRRIFESQQSLMAQLVAQLEVAAQREADASVQEERRHRSNVRLAVWLAILSAVLGGIIGAVAASIIG